VRNLIEGELEELYDMQHDPEELDNLALEPRHARRLATYREKAIAELRRTDAPFVGNMPRPGTGE